VRHTPPPFSGPPALVRDTGAAQGGGMGKVLRRAVVALAVIAVVILVACSGDDGAVAPVTTAPPTTGVPVTEPPTTALPTTALPTTEATVPVTTEAPTTTVEEYPTTTVHQVPDDCDVDAMLATVDETIAMARLEPGGAWSFDTAGVAFDDRTNDGEEFRDRLGFDCHVRAVQRTPQGAERLLLGAWTGERSGYSIQATDGPSTPYAPEARFQLLFEQPRGEWLVNQFIWAGTLEGGETVIVGAHDRGVGAVAKDWQALPRWDDIEVSNGTEQYVIDALLHAGARNVSPGEPAQPGSELAQIQFVTPRGLQLVATVAPEGWFDPDAGFVEGDTTVEQLDGVDVWVTRAAPESFAVASTAWVCDGYVWFIDSSWGTVEELVEWTALVISSTAC
jgi:hypothetical protein